MKVTEKSHSTDARVPNMEPFKSIFTIEDTIMFLFFFFLICDNSNWQNLNSLTTELVQTDFHK